MVILNYFLDFGINSDILSKLFKKSYKEILAIFSKQQITLFGIFVKLNKGLLSGIIGKCIFNIIYLFILDLFINNYKLYAIVVITLKSSFDDVKVFSLLEII